MIDEFNSSGEYLGQTKATPEGSFETISGIVVNSEGYLYVVMHGLVDEFLPVFTRIPEVSLGPVTGIERISATLHAEAEPTGGKITSCRFEFVGSASYKPWEDDPYSVGATSGTAPCLNDAGEEVGNTAKPIESTIELHADPHLIAGTEYHWRLSLANSNSIPRRVAGEIFTTNPAVEEVETGAAEEVGDKSATLTGSFNGNGEDTHYFFEYGTSSNYGHRWPAPPGIDRGVVTGTQSLSVVVGTENENLLPGTTYHYRVVADNAFGLAFGEDRTFTTFQSPTIESTTFSDVTATAAKLEARINPQGFESTYRFEYGTTTTYGQSAPVPIGQVATGLAEGHSVEVPIGGLQTGTTYHFRLLATNKWGTTKSEDQTFEFFPPNCPNAAVRQQTGSNYLPDCRGYELVSPGNANGTLFYPGGPNTGQATNPSRFSFTGAWSQAPGANAINTAGDLYAATRTDAGWKSNYVGLAGSEAGCAGGPPTDPGSSLVLQNPQSLANTVQSDPAMSRFLDFNDGAPVFCLLGANGTADANWALAPPSAAPYLWNADGTLVQRLPTNLGEVAGAEEAFKCPYLSEHNSTPHCGGETLASGDLSHLAFSSNRLSFAGEEGLTEAPGSAYDNDIATNTVRLISKLPSGKNIVQGPSYANPQEFIRFPAISTDGSHILMSTATATTEPVCEIHENSAGACHRFTDTPIHLYMSIDDSPAIEIAEGKAVHYVGMTPDGSEVFFTSAERLSPEDHDTGVDLYMWSQAGQEAGRPLTLISKGDNEGNAGEPGNSDECAASWVTKCGVEPWSDYSYSWLSNASGGNGITDSAIAANGDIYFYSPEQLDGDHGVLGQQNLYDYRGGEAKYVATLSPGNLCTRNGFGATICSEGPITRMDVSPDDSHMAFTTASRLTSYDNAGHQEMYTYTPSSGTLICDSCRPDGQPASGDVQASQDGSFMTDDGRSFFSTTEALVPQDTDEAEDVYEYVDGRPQLITPGTGTATVAQGTDATDEKGANLASVTQSPGLVGVSANGTDVYFSTFDSLVAEDHNGNFLKFYDARSDGGFAQPTPVPPCSAAEECHGAGSSAPELPAQGTAAGISNGNVKPQARVRHKKRHGKGDAAVKRHRARQGRANHGGAR